MADINDLIARGITPPPAPDLISNLSKATAIQQQRANIGQTQAQTGLLGAQQQEATARAGAIQTQQQGEAIGNALKYRQLQAYHVLQGLIQQNTVKNPDGTTSTNMPAVMGAYAQQFPDYALDLRKRQLEMEKSQVDLGKSNLDLQSAQTQRKGLVMGLAGIGDPNSPLAPQKYAQVYQQGQQEGWGANLPTPQEYAKNPAAYASRLADDVNSSGSKTAVLQQQKAQLEAGQQQRTLARQEYSALMANATPADYPSVYNKVGQDFPNVFPQLGFIPPNQVNPQNFAWMQQSARMMGMTPEQQQAAVTELYKAQNLAHLQGLQGIEAGAQAQKAATEAGVAEQTLQQTYSVNSHGQPVRPMGTSANDSPVINAPGKGQLDLSQFGPWQSESPRVRQTALAILGGSPLSGFDTKDPVVTRALNLATKVDPQIYAHEQAQKKFWNENQNTITAANTAIQHSDELNQYARQLEQRNPGFINMPLSELRNQFGSQVQSEFENRRDKYVAEVEKYVHGAGFTEKQADEARDKLSNAKTWGQLEAVVRDNNRMIQQKAQIMNHQYNVQNAGNILGGGVDVLQPQTKAILAKQGLIKSATQQNISAYASKKGIPIGKAEQEFKDAGYSIIK